MRRYISNIYFFKLIYIFILARLCICDQTNNIINEESFSYPDMIDYIDAEFNRIFEAKFHESYLKCENTLSHHPRKINDTLIANKYLGASINPYGDDDPSTLSGKLFFYNHRTIGLVTNSDMSIRFYEYDLKRNTITPYFTKYFYPEVPFAACADRFKSIYVVFPDQNKIARYLLTPNQHKKAKASMEMKEVRSIVLDNFSPSAIACFNNRIYVTERPTNLIKIFDRSLNYVGSIQLNGVVISAQRALSINKNIRIFADDASAVALFNNPVNPTDNSSDVCHFYINMNCIEDVYSVAAQANKQTMIYVADSCNHTIRQLLYIDHTIYTLNSINTNGIPISVLSDENGYLFVLTSRPYKIDIHYPSDDAHSLQTNRIEMINRLKMFK